MYISNRLMNSLIDKHSAVFYGYRECTWQTNLYSLGRVDVTIIYDLLCFKARVMCSHYCTLTKIINLCIWIELTPSTFLQGPSWCRRRRYSSPEMTYRTMYCVTFEIKRRGIRVLWFLINYFIMHGSLLFLLPKVVCIRHECVKQETRFLIISQEQIRRQWQMRSTHVSKEFN